MKRGSTPSDFLKRFLLLSLGLSMAFAPAAPALAQGLLIVHHHHHPVPLPRPVIHIHPRPPRPAVPTMTYKIKELLIQARVTDQIARVQVSQTFVNTGNRQMEVSFVFPLPYDGAIDQLTLMVDGKEYEAKLLPAKEARAIYEGYLRRNRDPALLEWMGMGMFKTSVFPVPVGAERTVTLRFSQLLRKDHHLTDFLYPLSTAKYTSQPVERLKIDVAIESEQEIKSVYSPTHSIEIKRTDEKHATVKYEGKNEIPANDFRLFYDTAKTKLSASVVSFRPNTGEDGYFLLLASPPVKAKKADRMAKNVILVMDRSGSMNGKKIEQAKEALKFVLNNLHDGDLFNIVAYDSSVEKFRPELQRYDDETRKAALGFVEGIYAGGSTNIDGALSTALAMIQDSSRPNYVVFLTDGLPTAGETNESKIVEASRKRNTHHARLVSFGVGYDVNSRLLDRLSRGNHGQSEFVRPDENIEVHVSRLYSRISSPVMTNVVIDVDLEGSKLENGRAVNRVYPREVHDLFAGEQVVMVGRYKQAGIAKVTITGQVGSKQRKYDFPAKFVASSDDQSYGFVEKLWAMRRIGEIIDELDLKGKNQELINELVSLSTHHGILTPYTSFLADDQAPATELTDARLRSRASELLSRLDESVGRRAFAQRAEKKSLQEAARLPTGGLGDAFGRAAPAADAGASPANRPGSASRPGSGSSRLGGIAGGGGKFGLPSSSRPSVAATPALGLKYRDIESDREMVTNAVQNVGQQTLYKRGKLWIATNAKDIDPEKDKSKIQVVKRFSPEYFTLIADNTKNENAVFARQQVGEELLIKLRGQVYRIQ